MENLNKTNEIFKKAELNCNNINEEEKKLIKNFGYKIENSDENKEELKKIFLESINKNYLYILKHISIDCIFSENEIIDLLKSEIENQEIKEEIKNKVFNFIRYKGTECNIKFFEDLSNIQYIIEDDVLISKITDLYFVSENQKERNFLDNIIKLLIEKTNININARGNDINTTLLHELINNEPKNIDLIKLLIEKENIDFSIENYCNDTIFDIISFEKENIDLTIENYYNNIIFKIISLEKKNIDLAIKNYYNNIILNIISFEKKKKDNEEIINLIIEKAKKTNQINDLLFVAIKNNKINTIELLLNHPEININEFNYYDMLHLAIESNKVNDKIIESNNQNITKLLKEKYKKIGDNNQKITQLLDDEENIKLCYEYIKNKNYNETFELIKKIKDLNLKVNETTLLHETVNVGYPFNGLFINLVLKQNNINLDIKDSNGLTPFELAVKNNDFGAVSILSKYIEKIKPNLNINKLFYYVCKNNSVEMFNLLINKLSLPTPDLSLKYENNQNLLHVICSKENTYIRDDRLIKLLLNNKSITSALDERDYGGFTPFELAVKNNNFEIVSILSNYNIEKIKSSLDIDKLFYYVCKNSSVEILNLLIDKLSLPTPDLSLKYEKKQNLLHIICSEGNTNRENNILIIKKLLDNISNVSALNERNDNGFTPLHLAIKNNNNDIIEYLLKRKEINLTIEDYDGLNPINLAIKNGNFYIFKSLFDVYQNKNLININNLFYYACKSENWEILNFLISQNNPNLSFKYAYGQNLLHLVCANNNITKNGFNVSFELIKLLLNNNANILDLNIPDKNGDTPLDLAIKNNNYFTTKFLIRRINLENQNIKSLKLVKEENKIYLLRDICFMGDTEKFFLLYNEEYLGNNFKNPIFYFELLNNAYINNNNKKIISKLEENLDIQIKNLIEKTTINNVLNVLNNITYNINNPNFELYNKLIKNIENSNIKNNPVYQEYKNKKLFNGINQNAQGENQVTINRELDKSEKAEELYLTVDIAYGKIKENGKINQNEILYEIIKYLDDGCTLVNYYKKGTTEKSNENELLSATIDKDGIIRFSFNPNENPECLEKEIDRILNNNYLDTKSFDHTLSYLAYVPIQLKENIENTIIRVNCNLEIIADNLKNSLEDESKTYICDLNIDGHNVQTVIYKGKLNIINTGYDFGYLHKDIKEVFNKKYKEDKIEINEIKSIEQLGGNCVLASKLYLKSLITQNKTNYKRLINAINRWQNIYEEQELNNKNITTSDIEKIDSSLNPEEKEDLKKILDLNSEIFRDNSNQFVDNNSRFNKLKEYYFLKEINDNPLQIISIPNNPSDFFLTFKL